MIEQPQDKLFAEELKPHERKNLWLYKGINLATDGRLRCPHCNRTLAEGRYPESPMRFVCPSCKKTSVFERIQR